MPNTKSAERRARNSERKHARNRSDASKLATLEKNFRALAGTGDREKAGASLKSITAALDKAAKRNSIHKATANRKKSRLALVLNKMK